MKIKMNKKDKKRISNKLKDCNYNVRAYYLVIDPDVQKYRTIEEIITLIDILTKHNYNRFVYDLLRDPDVQKYRAIEEIIILTKELKNCNYNEKVYNLVISPDIQKNHTIEEIVKLMEKLKNYLNIKQYKDENIDVKADTKILKYTVQKEEK